MSDWLEDLKGEVVDEFWVENPEEIRNRFKWLISAVEHLREENQKLKESICRIDAN